jgi:predicted P-loop ATPase
LDRIELSELDNLSHAEVARIKAFMSRTTDRFRSPYGMRLVESPRQCVFAGTVNHGTYLRDETGRRRFWPVVCGQIDVDALARDRDQLWAESDSQQALFGGSTEPIWYNWPVSNRRLAMKVTPGKRSLVHH